MIKKLVPRPAWKLWKYLEALHRIGGWISISVKKIAAHFKRGISTIRRWFGMLYAAGVLQSERRGPRPPVYTVLIATTDTCNRVPSLYEPTEELQSAPATPIAQKIREYFGPKTVAGKTADRPLINRIGRLVRDESGLARFKGCVYRWLKRKNKPRSWGIFVTLAEDAGRELAPPPKPPPAPPPAAIPKPEATNLLASLGIDPNLFRMVPR